MCIRDRVWAHPLAQPAIEDWPAYRAQRLGFWLKLLLAAGVPEAQAEATATVYKDLKRFQSSAPIAHFLHDQASIQTVSYTHLDVYKRQVSERESVRT